MPLQNRVLPNGEIVALADRGTLTGNRGIIHGPDKHLARKRWSHQAWICCVLDWQGRKRDVMTGRKWTELFFLDEAVAMAAGHRPCGYCRRADYSRFKEIWQRVRGPAISVKDIDKALHQARVLPRTREQRTLELTMSDLPNGAFFRSGGQSFLVRGDRALLFTPAGYTISQYLTEQLVEVLTPMPMVEVLRAGYRPKLHPSAI